MKIQKRSKMSVAPLPDDVVMEILSRMPAHEVLKCRRVCRRWRVLLSTHHFQEMHLKVKAYHSPMILVEKIYLPRKKNIFDRLLLLDKWEQPRKRATIRRLLNFIDNSGSSLTEVIQSSYDGLIVMSSFDSKNRLMIFTVFNPISRDTVSIKCGEFQCVYGMFFNPLIKEYCILLGKYGSAFGELQMLNLGAQPSCRNLEISISSPHKPLNPFLQPPVVIDDATIYWLVGGGNHSCQEHIMAFNIKTEEFTLMPHPHPIDDCQSQKHYFKMHITKIDGRLSFVENTVIPERTLLIINIWALKDSAARLWIKTHSVSIDVNGLNIKVYSGFRVMVVRNGELLLNYLDEGRLYSYDLELGTLRNIMTAYRDLLYLSIYTPSFVSLRNCKSEICI